MDFFIQITFNGLSVGAIYGLVAAGFSITYLATGRFNFGLGMWVMLGAMLTYSLVESAGIHPLLALLIVAAFTFYMGKLTELISVKPFRETKNDLWIVATLAVGLILVDSAELIWGHYPLRVTQYFGESPLHWNGVSIRSQQLIILASLLILYIFFEIVLKKTISGLSFRAAASDRDTAELMGIKPRFVEQFSFAIAASIAGCAGFLIVPIVGAEANIGAEIGFKGFAVAIVGGLSAPRGALIVGLLYGFFESAISAYFFSGLRDILTFSTMIIILYLMPYGIFGKPELEAR